MCVCDLGKCISLYGKYLVGLVCVYEGRDKIVLHFAIPLVAV